MGKRFTTLVEQSNDASLFISKMKTVNERGEVLATHEIKMLFDEVLGEEYFDLEQPHVQIYEQEGKTIKVSKTNLLIVKNTVLKSSIIEGTDDTGRRLISIVINDINGRELSRQTIED